ncbi:DUF5776 domain-containing protein [Secundilactobacillus yichangensis]|uniref:DUF5776 domain-containing protein n=1 Tax=Secundilactobacillus yichangensis TaxID=2799580 RepID=UPI001940B8B4|nr:MucBP domain-containing protein [Secundilactobacillus yichangensis]
MTKYRLKHSFKNFPSHYFYVVALVSTGLFFGHNVTTVKAASQTAIPTAGTTSTADQQTNSTVLRSSSTVAENNIKQKTVGIDTTDSSTEKSAELGQTEEPTTVTTIESSPTESSDLNNPNINDDSGPSTGTSTAEVTLTPPDGIIPISGGPQNPPDTGSTAITTGSTGTSQTPTITVTLDPQNTTLVTADALGVKPVDSIKLNVPVPTDGKDAIKATNKYFYKLGDVNFQLTNSHGSLRDVSITPGTWQGSEYAAAIPTNAKGIDPKTGYNYIDEWMPDQNLQDLLFLVKYPKKYSSFDDFRDLFSKSNLSTLTDFTVTTAQQQTSTNNLTPTPIYYALQQTQTLEGLQYAKKLSTINFTLNYNVSEKLYGGNVQSKLWDISALEKITSLRMVRFLYTSIQDISALKTYSKLTDIELSFNQISDISGFKSNWTHLTKGNPRGSARYSGISLPLLVLKPGTTSVEVSYNVKGTDGSLRHMIPSDGADINSDYPETYEAFKASTADGVSEDNHTIVFYNLLTPPDGDVGWLSAGHTFYMDGDDGSAFDVWVSIPYIISNDYGTANVNYENLLPDGQQEAIATSTPLSGEINASYNIATDPSTTYPLEWLMYKYGSNYIVLNGTGNYSDYLANNGLAQAVPVTGTYSAEPQNLTVLFAPSQLTVQHGYYQSDGQFTSLAPETQVEQSLTADLSIKDQVTDIQNFHYIGAEIVANDGTVKTIDSTTTTLPYLSTDNILRIVYEPNQITIPVTYIDNLKNVLRAASNYIGTAIDTLSSSSTAAQLPIPDYTFDHYEKSDGTPITTAVSLTDLRAGLKLIYTGNTLQIPVNYIDNFGNPLQTSQIQGAINAPLADDFTTNQQIDIPDYTFVKIETNDHQPIPAKATYNTIREGILVVYQGNTISVPVYFKDTNGTKITDSVTLSAPINTQFTQVTLTGLPQLHYYDFVGAQDMTGKVLPLPVVLATIRDGVQLIYSEKYLSTTIPYIDGSTGQPLFGSANVQGQASDKVTNESLNIPEIPGYNFDRFSDNAGNPLLLPITIGEIADGGLQVIYRPIQVTVPVYYVDTYGETIANNHEVAGNYLDSFTADSLTSLQQTIPGYTFSRVQAASGAAVTLPNILGQLQNGIYLVYTLNNINITPPATPEVTLPVENPGDNNHEVVPPKVIYAMKQLNLYSEVNFTADNIIMTYVKKPRIYRPRFVVIGTARDSQNRLRYLVRDINTKSDTFGLVGYVTANTEFVRSAYYHSVPTTITVISPRGINGYVAADLTGKLTHYRQGTVLKVASVIQNRTATRFVLTNGQIVTASKLLVKMGTVPQPKRATKISAMNRYNDLNLTTQTAHFKQSASKTFSILSWDYSNGNNYHVKSLKRYQIKDGYITAYSKLVKSEF